MPESSDSSVYRSLPGLTITIRTLPGDGRGAYGCLAGESDRDSLMPPAKGEAGSRRQAMPGPWLPRRCWAT